MAEPDKTGRENLDNLLEKLNRISSAVPSQPQNISRSPAPESEGAVSSVASEAAVSAAAAVPAPEISSTAAPEKAAVVSAAASAPENEGAVSASAPAASAAPVAPAPAASTPAPAEDIFDTKPLITEDFRKFFTEPITPKALLAEAAKKQPHKRVNCFSEVAKKADAIKQSLRRRAELERMSEQAQPEEEPTLSAKAAEAVTKEKAPGDARKAAQPEVQPKTAPKTQPKAVQKDAPKSEPKSRLEMEPETQPEAAPAGAQRQEYTDPTQKQRITHVLAADVHKWSVCCTVLGLVCLAAVCLFLAAVFPAQRASSVLTSGATPLVLYLVLLLIGCGVSLPVLKNGAQQLWGKGHPDSLVFLSCCGAVVQNLALFAHADSFRAAEQPVLSLFALLALLANAVGKRSLAAGVYRRFRALTAESSSYMVASLAHRPTLVSQLTSGLGETDPWLLVSHTADFYDGFLRQVSSGRPYAKAIHRLCCILVFCGLLAGLVGGVSNRDFFSPLCYTFTVACPLSAIFVSSVPDYFMQRKAATFGAILPGPAALRELEQVNVIHTTAEQLFPAGSVRLRGMKIFHEARIDHAILYAASLLVPNCITLRHVFLSVIQDHTDILYPVEQLEEQPGMGWCGVANGRQLCIGNRAMLAAHGVTLPKMDYELRYTQNGRYCPIYLSVDGLLYAMFVISYGADRTVKEQLNEVYKLGLSLLVRGNDFNLSSERIEETYGIPSGCIKLLNAENARLLESLLGHRSHCEGCLLHRNSFYSLVSSIRVAASGMIMERAAFAIQTAFTALTAFLVLVFTAAGSLSGFAPLTLLIYQLVGLAFTMLLPVVKQY